MPAKPSILRSYDDASATSALIPDAPGRPSRPFLSASNDVLYLEDDHARVALDVCKLAAHDAARLITGLVVGVRGCESKTTGSFQVLDIANARPAPLPSLPSSSSGDAKAVACIVSGLQGPRAQLLAMHLGGVFGKVSEAACVALLIVAGLRHDVNEEKEKGKEKERQRQDIQLQTLKESDALLTQLAMTLPTALMPAAGDVTTALLPLQPVHKCVLPGAARCSGLRRVPNPCAVRAGGAVVAGTCGENVADVAMYREREQEEEVNGEVNGEMTLDVLESMLINRHLAPTCPDTLGAYPFTDTDPFVMDQSPHVLFAGGQRDFATRLVPVAPCAKKETQQQEEEQEEQGEGENAVRLISVPRFDETGIAVFVDLDTLDVWTRNLAVVDA